MRRLRWPDLRNARDLGGVPTVDGGRIRDRALIRTDNHVREIREELSVTIAPDTAEHVGTFHAQAHGHPQGTIVRMTCYTADYQGVLQPDSEIEEIVWLTHADRHRGSPVDQIIFDHLHGTARIR